MRLRIGILRCPQKPVLLEMAKYFDVGITHGPDETITHTLSTTLIGPDGKVVQFYPGNEWTPEQVVADVKIGAALRMSTWQCDGHEFQCGLIILKEQGVER